MSGKTGLEELIRSMRPILHKGEYVFCSVTDTNIPDFDEVILLFKEAEGTTVILKKDQADAFGLSYTFVAAWITLTVHSSLAAVGFTGAFSKALTEANISCNVVAGYYHDHIFVPQQDATRAMTVLRNLSSQSRETSY